MINGKITPAFDVQELPTKAGQMHHAIVHYPKNNIIIIKFIQDMYIVYNTTAHKCNARTKF